MDSSLGPVQEGMERPTGFEPVPGPWQGPVLPLYYGRPIQRNIITATIRRQGPSRRSILTGLADTPEASRPGGLKSFHSPQDNGISRLARTARSLRPGIFAAAQQIWW